VTPGGRVAFAPTCLIALAGLMLAAVAASAQARGGATLRRVEVGGGGGVVGGVSLGERDATLLTNNTNGTAFRLFSTESRLRPAPFVEARLGYRVTPRFTAEGRLTIARPTLRVSVTADIEDAAPVEAEERLTEYVLEGGVQWRLATSPRRRLIPFASGGAGLARHVHERRSLIEDGLSGYVGGGALYLFGGTRTPAGGRTSGFRFDARLQFLGGGLASGASAPARGAASASVFVAF
jgi:hypothetical protein